MKKAIEEDWILMDYYDKNMIKKIVVFLKE